MSWNDEIINLLEKVRLNSITLSEYHRKRFYHFKSFSKYFDLPILVFSSVGASFSVGTQAYLPQDVISMTTCFIGLVISIITSIKLYLNIDDSMMVELKMSKDFYSLGVDIYKTLHLKAEDRGEDGLNYLNKQYGIYTKLVENSNLLKKRFKADQLAEVNKKMLILGDSDSDIESGNSTPILYEKKQPMPEKRIRITHPPLLKTPSPNDIFEKLKSKSIINNEFQNVETASRRGEPLNIDTNLQQTAI